MENSKISNHAIGKKQLFEVWQKESSKEEKHDAIVKYVLNVIGDVKISNYEYSVEEKVRHFCKYLATKWVKCGRKAEKIRNDPWLESELIFAIQTPSTNASTSAAGRPKLHFIEKSEYGKKKAAAELATQTNFETNLLVRAAVTSARRQGDADLVAVLTETFQSPTRPSKIRKLCTEEQKNPIVLSADEALAFILENNFSKDQYNAIRSQNKLKNCDIYPHYNEVAAAKLKCRPDGVSVSETVAKVSLKSVLSHTAQRIVHMQKEVFESIMEAENTNYLTSELILSYGFDSSTGQAQFKQSFQEPSTSQSSDCSLLATTMMPLRLVVTSGKIVWNNRTPQSIRFCRPIKLEFVKETKESVLKEDLDLKHEIDGLENVLIEIGEGKTVEISFKLCLTLIDGKVLSILTETKSTQACPICGATPKDFVNTYDYSSQKFRAKESNFKYGMSPLHCWIRFFEFILHLGYKCIVQKWQIRTEANKLAVSKWKISIQDAFWKELGLRVDMPKVGGFGSTNDGNTARRSFTDHAIFAKITGVDENLVFRFKIILICLSCQFPINSYKFQAYCFETGAILQKLYPWLPMTATVHKVLVHSKDIIENTVLPVGSFGETAAESRHKVYKADRLHHTRKNSRTNNLADVFNRALDTSDPLISSKYLQRRIQQRKLTQFPREAIELLSFESRIGDTDVDSEIEENMLLPEESAIILQNLCLDNELN